MITLDSVLDYRVLGGEDSRLDNKGLWSYDKVIQRSSLAVYLPGRKLSRVISVRAISVFCISRWIHNRSIPAPTVGIPT